MKGCECGYGPYRFLFPSETCLWRQPSQGCVPSPHDVIGSCSLNSLANALWFFGYHGVRWIVQFPSTPGSFHCRAVHAFNGLSQHFVTFSQLHAHDPHYYCFSPFTSYFCSFTHREVSAKYFVRVGGKKLAVLLVKSSKNPLVHLYASGVRIFCSQGNFSETGSGPSTLLRKNFLWNFA